jgi:hypothetical protein
VKSISSEEKDDRAAAAAQEKVLTHTREEEATCTQLHTGYAAAILCSNDCVVQG